jgi:hypothetical protein
LYLSDQYAANVAGTKTSLFTEVKKRGFDIVWKDVHSAGVNRTNGKDLLNTLRTGKYTDLWISHTWTEFVGCDLDQINKLGVKVLGFGFSDPYEWDGNKLRQYNYYATNHLDTYVQLQKNLPVHYFPTACDTAFHKQLNLEKTTDILVFGQGEHPRFSPPAYRLTMLNGVVNTYKNVKVFGRKWGSIAHSNEISGDVFLTEINKAKISLDLQQLHAPLAHRMFECMACGTLVVTRDRPEVRRIFDIDTDVLYYTDLADLKSKIGRLLYDLSLRNSLAAVMYNKVRTQHSILNRVDRLLQFLRGQKRL